MIKSMSPSSSSVDVLTIQGTYDLTYEKVKERIIEDYLDKRFFTKPSAKRRREKIKKLKNAQKAEANRNKALDTKNKKSRRR